MYVAVDIRLHKYWHEQVKIRKKRWNNKEIKKSFQMLQYSQTIFSCNCRSDAESENKTVSSAYSNTKSFK
jgi:hypothetical protein